MIRDTMNKAFIASLISIMFAGLVLTLWANVQQSALLFERTIVDAVPLAYTGYLFENVFEEVSVITESPVSIEANNVSFIISLSDALPQTNFTSSLDTYESFLENNFSSRIHANISANFSNLTDGSLDMVLLDEYRYRTNYSSLQEVLFYSLSQSQTRVSRIDINITTNLIRQSVTMFTWTAGDMNVTLTYADANGTIVANGTLRNDTVNTFSILYSGNQTTNITLGRVGALNGSFLITDTAGTDYSIAMRIPLNLSKEVSIAYEAPLNYTQGSVAKHALVGK